MLVGFGWNADAANKKAAELAPKGYETSINSATKTFRDRKTGMPIEKTVYKVWARDEAMKKYRYKPDGRRNW